MRRHGTTLTTVAFERRHPTSPISPSEAASPCSTAASRSASPTSEASACYTQTRCFSSQCFNTEAAKECTTERHPPTGGSATARPLLPNEPGGLSSSTACSSVSIWAFIVDT